MLPLVDIAREIELAKSSTHLALDALRSHGGREGQRRLSPRGQGRGHELGYTIEDEDEVLGVYCVAAPIRDVTLNVAASIGVIGLKAELRGGGLDSIGSQLRESATHISEKLGYAE
jgi:DNA-binding IclR family transcriptional regulator